MAKLALLLLMVGACTSSSDDGDGEFQGTQVVGAIDFKMRGGLGGNGDGTAAHIEPDGAATRRLPGGATATVQLSEERVKEIYDQVARAELDTRQPYYNAGGDYYVYVVAAELASGQVTVSLDQEASVPQTLRNAVIELHKFAQTGE